MGARQWQSYQKEKGKKKKTLVLEPSGYLGAALHSLSQGCPSGAQAKQAVKQLPEAESLGEKNLQPLSCTSHFPRKKPKKRKQDKTSGQRRKIPSVTQLHGVFMAKRTFSSFEYWGISFLLNTSILGPISETGHTP